MPFFTYDWSLIDGRAGAPVGVSAQYPTLFTGFTGIVYPFRPQWRVAGVDYGSGPAAATVYKNPLVDTLPTGATVDNTNKLIRTNSTNNLTFDSWDFVTSGYGLYVNGTTANTTVTNCKFAVNALAKPPIQADTGGGALTVRYCVIDGGGATATSVPYMIRSGAAGDLIVEYCWIKNAPNDSINPGTGRNYTIQFNLIESGMWDAASHSDFCQTQDTVLSLKYWFNTFYQPAADVVTGFPGSVNAIIRVADFTGTNTGVGVDVGYNTVIGVGTGHKTGTGNDGLAINNFMQIGASGSAFVVSPYIHDNYVDPTSLSNFSGGVNNTSGTPVFSNNIKLTDGTRFTSPY